VQQQWCITIWVITLFYRVPFIPPLISFSPFSLFVGLLFNPLSSFVWVSDDRSRGPKEKMNYSGIWRIVVYFGHQSVARFSFESREQCLPAVSFIIFMTTSLVSTARVRLSWLCMLCMLNVAVFSAWICSAVSSATDVYYYYYYYYYYNYYNYYNDNYYYYCVAVSSVTMCPTVRWATLESVSARTLTVYSGRLSPSFRYSPVYNYSRYTAAFNLR